MARPKKGEEMGATAALTMRVKPETRAAVDGEAVRTGETVTDTARTLIEEALAARAKRREKIAPPPPKVKK